MKEKILIFLIAGIALIAGFFLQSSVIQQETKTLPDFTFPDITDKQHTLSEWKGKILIINFWAVWCPSCLEEMPQLVDIQNQFANKNIQVIGIALDNQTNVSEFLKTHAINYPILVSSDLGMVLMRQLGNQVGVVPYTIIVNEQGSIIKTYSGDFDKTELVTNLTKKR